MTPADIVTTLNRAGVKLVLIEDRLRVWAASSAAYTQSLRRLVAAHRTDLIAFLREQPRSPTQVTPRDHFFSLADDHNKRGIVERFGSKATGELWLAMQAWDRAHHAGSSDAEALKLAYFCVWEKWKGEEHAERICARSDREAQCR